MADTKITALAAISTIDAAVDPLAIVDVSDTSMAASGTTKKVTSQQILGSGGNASVGTLNASGAATLSSTLAVTGTSTFTGAMTANGNTTLGNAQTDVITINGQLQAREGELASSIRAAASDYAGVAFDGATSGTRVTSTLTGQNIGTGDFSVWSRFKVFETTGTTRYIASLTSSQTTADQARAILLYINSTGALNVYLYGATVSDFRQATVSGFQSSYSGQIVDVVLTRSGGSLKLFINGSDTSYTETSGGTPPAWSETVTSTYLFLGQSTGTSNIFLGPIYRSVLFNRALSAADVVDLIETGVNPADQWGSQTVTYNKSTFASGVADSWNVTDVSNITATTGATAPDATTDWLKVERTGAASGRCDINRGLTVVTGNKRFRASALIYNEDCGTQWFGVQADNYSTLFASSGQLSNGSQGTISQEFISGSSTALRIGPIPSSVSATGSGVVSNGGNYYVKAITVTRIGAIVDLDFTTGIGYQATGRSTNSLHGTLFGGVSWTQPKKKAVLYATTNTNGNQQILATTAIPTSAFIEAIIVNSDGSGTATTTVSVGTASAGTQIVNAGSISTGRNVLTLATRFSSTGNLWVNANGTSNLQFTILYTDAA